MITANFEVSQKRARQIISQNITTSDPTKFCLTPLANYIEKARQQEEELYGSSFTLTDEVAAARGSLQVFVKLLEQNIARFNKVVEKNPHDKAALEILSSLMLLSERFIETTSKFGRLVKAGAEIETIKATRLDAVQLLYILSQIPDLISSLVETVIRNIVSEIQIAVEKSSAIPDSRIKDLHKEIPYFGKRAPVAIAGHVNNLVDDISSHLETVSVPHDKSRFPDKPNGSSNNSSVTEDQIEAMLNSVPSVINVPSGNGDEK